MNEFKTWSNEALAAKAVNALIQNNFAASYVKTRQEAVEKLLAMVPAAASIGVGGSWTLTELGVLEKWQERGHTIYNHNLAGLPAEEVMALRRAELTCDVFICGTNALTLDGKLVNVDGVGNRVAAMTFGPKQVIIVAGVNKIVRNVDEAERRIELLAAPLNNKRLNRPNPCTVAGICVDCQGPTRICNVTTILRKRPPATPMQILIVGEELGF
ncbi:MAG: lactate utilization protein [Sporomusaceae bacterium]|nr:lactate utilization protein [Sporomusaceae bacterium]